MSETQKQAIEKKSSTSVATMFEADSFAGLKNVKSESVALPILKLLQNGSGEAQKRNENYVEGAEPGMFLNTVTKKLYDGDKGIFVIPCDYKLEYQEWADYGTGSGRPENIFDDTSDILTKTTKDQIGKDRLPNGNYILTVGQHYVLILSENGGAEPALISLSSSQGKVSRKWNSMMMSITLDGQNGPYTPASFSHIYKLNSVLNTGKGNQWYGYNVSLYKQLEEMTLYERAKKFHQSLQSK